MKLCPPWYRRDVATNLESVRGRGCPRRLPFSFAFDIDTYSYNMHAHNYRYMCVYRAIVLQIIYWMHTTSCAQLHIVYVHCTPPLKGNFKSTGLKILARRKRKSLQFFGGKLFASSNLNSIGSRCFVTLTLQFSNLLCCLLHIPGCMAIRLDNIARPYTTYAWTAWIYA